MTLTKTETLALRSVFLSGGMAARKTILPRSNERLVNDALYCLVEQTPYLDEPEFDVFQITQEGIAKAAA